LKYQESRGYAVIFKGGEREKRKKKTYWLNVPHQQEQNTMEGHFWMLGGATPALDVPHTSGFLFLFLFS